MKNLAEMIDLNLNRRQLTLIQAITQEPKLYRALWEIGGQGRNGLASLALRAHCVRLSPLRGSVELPTRGFSVRSSALFRKPICRTNQFVHDARFVARVAGIADQLKVGFGPGGVNIPGGPCRRTHIVAALN